MSVLRAYHGSIETKDFYLGRVAQHCAADELIKGKYWEGGRGCAVGCTVHSDEHFAYESELGIPRILARLEDRIFEGLALPAAKLWPERFLSAIAVGADLSLVWPKFAVWLLADPADGVVRFAKTEPQKAVIERVAELFRRLANGEEVEIGCFREAREEAWRVRNTTTATTTATTATPTPPTPGQPLGKIHI